LALGFGRANLANAKGVLFLLVLEEKSVSAATSRRYQPGRVSLTL
jgi:hypothetical protein